MGKKWESSIEAEHFSLRTQREGGLELVEDEVHRTGTVDWCGNKADWS